MTPRTAPPLEPFIERVIVPALLERFLAQHAPEREAADVRVSSARPQQSAAVSLR